MRFFFILFLTLISNVVLAENDEAAFQQYVVKLRQEALSKGFSPELLDKAFTDIKFYKRAVKADKNQPEFKQTLDTYLPKRVPKWKVDRAVALFNEHQALLQRVAEHYGVQARFIVALWGVESNFGRITGNYPVMSALTTLAFEGRRETFFKRQVFAALQILQEGHIETEQFYGSWAGAMGQSQFMPSSFLHYAQDFDGDGRKDIWQSLPDVLASIANYLASEGWDNSQTWGRQVTVPDGFDERLSGLHQEKMQSLLEWQRAGVRRLDGRDLPDRDIPASLIIPDDLTGRIYLVYNNFHTLMDWNRSTYFGVTVGHLSDRIKLGR
ncbi:MAG: lytic transglycosylase domain-containing protein [Aestuariibacter sp.]